MLFNVLLEEAQELLLDNIIPLESESIPFEQALGRIAAYDFFAPANLPSYSQAAVDGYAVHRDDLNIGQALITKHCYDKEHDIVLQQGQATGVLTGRPLPDDTGAVVAQEFVTVKEDKLLFPINIPAGSNMKQPGEDFKFQELVLRRGTAIDLGMIGVFAAFGQSEVKVYRRPRVMILSFAGEVVPHHAIPEFGQIRDCNGPLLAAMVTGIGGQVGEVCIIDGGSREEARDIINKMVRKADLILTIGRTASGKDDYALALLRELGAKVLFWGVKIKPGSHSGAAVLESKPVISLSGNPAACAVGYQLLADPVLRALQGLNPSKHIAAAAFNGSFPKKGGPRRFLRGYTYLGDKGLMVDLLPGQKSSMLRSLLNWNSLIDLPAGHNPLKQGAEVRVMLLSNIPFVNCN